MASDIGWGIYNGDKCPIGGEGKVYAAFKNNQAMFIRQVFETAFVGTIANNAKQIQISGYDMGSVAFKLEEIAKTIAPTASTIPRPHIGIFTKAT